ncbi:hypothetical protein GCM10010954_32280 [Halobacillus andaensis]|uniref:Lipoprotein n=1 Tax=Halobacillus andaensis TaxID=1176239 RepID=A0A917B7X2_HALAA|nr:hypothetical protein [Halobacillus andaensis]MBP2005334.1 hypothetical protein [Halobacillus andaensis]GGF30646.1 hypothetical protein GCM10010954_32280 [Halobacillus andaensis]
MIKGWTLLILGSVFLIGCTSDSVDSEPTNKSEKEDEKTTEEHSAQLSDGEWEFSESLESNLEKALGKNPENATEEELYEVLDDESLREQYLNELYDLLELKVEDGLISLEEADAQKETMEFIFEEE